MPGTRTFTIIKPNAVEGRHIGEITAMIEQAGFQIIALKMTRLSRSDAERFYHLHQDKPFFDSLCLFMSSESIVAMILERENAVEELRKLVGATNPEEAATGSIRHRFGESQTKNAIHASDSDDNAAWESTLLFTDSEIVAAEYSFDI